MEISTTSSVLKPQAIHQDVKCFVCSGETPKYHCPRCGVHYCSLVCYKDSKHESCSEAFYIEQVGFSFCTNKYKMSSFQLKHLVE